jgi:energy-coupling factor transport system permease protein
MLKDITIGQYISGDSLLHKLDPRTKIMGIFILMITLFVVDKWYSLMLAAGVIFAVLFMSQVPVRYYLKGIRPLLFIIIFTAVIQLLLTPGQVVWQWKALHITTEGIHLAGFMCFRLILLVLITSVLTLTTTPISLTDAMETLLSPFKRFGLPVHELAMMMTIALRFIPTLIEETDKIIKAQTARGASFDQGGIISRARALLPVLVPLFLSAIKRADELSMAMEARCYHGGEGRTRLHELVYAKKDYVSLAVLIAFLAFCLALRVAL